MKKTIFRLSLVIAVFGVCSLVKADKTSYTVAYYDPQTTTVLITGNQGTMLTQDNKTTTMSTTQASQIVNCLLGQSGRKEGYHSDHGIVNLRINQTQYYFPANTNAISCFGKLLKR